MPKTPDNWPPGALPRGLGVDLAAYYVGLSPGAFLEQIRLGIYPQPLSFGRRKIWDRAALDAAIDRLSGQGWLAVAPAPNDADAIQERVRQRMAAVSEMEERVWRAHLAGERPGEIARREMNSPQGVAAIIRVRRKKEEPRQ